MRLLLDTHIAIWSLFEPERLTQAERDAFQHSANLCFVSMTSLWEAQIKRRLGKLPIPADFVQLIEQTTLQVLPITGDHVALLGRMDFRHRDPFDHLLAVQAIQERMRFVTRDSAFEKIGVDLFPSFG